MNRTTIIAVVAVVIVVTAVFVYLRSRRSAAAMAWVVPGQWPDFSLPRGIRNNNPGNIRVNNANNWLGKIPFAQNTDSTLVNGQPVLKRAFEQFTELRFGLRAMIRLIQNYQTNHGDNTLRKIINRYAPPNENHTNTYLNYIAGQVGIGPDAPFVANKENMRKLIPALVRYENGTQKAWINDNDFEAAWAIL